MQNITGNKIPMAFGMKLKQCSHTTLMSAIHCILTQLFQEWPEVLTLPEFLNSTDCTK